MRGSLNLQLCKYYSLIASFWILLFWLFSLAGDMDISVLSKYISEQKRVYPAVEGRIIVRGSSSTTAHSLGLLLLALCLSLLLWSPSGVPEPTDKLMSRFKCVTNTQISCIIFFFFTGYESGRGITTDAQCKYFTFICCARISFMYKLYKVDGTKTTEANHIAPLHAWVSGGFTSTEPLQQPPSAPKEKEQICTYPPGFHPVDILSYLSSKWQAKNNSRSHSFTRGPKGA